MNNLDFIDFEIPLYKIKLQATEECTICPLCKNTPVRKGKWVLDDNEYYIHNFIERDTLTYFSLSGPSNIVEIMVSEEDLCLYYFTTKEEALDAISWKNLEVHVLLGEEEESQKNTKLSERIGSDAIERVCQRVFRENNTWAAMSDRTKQQPRQMITNIIDAFGESFSVNIDTMKENVNGD